MGPVTVASLWLRGSQEPVHLAKLYFSAPRSKATLACQAQEPELGSHHLSTPLHLSHDFRARKGFNGHPEIHGNIVTQRKREKELKCAVQGKAGTRTQNLSPGHGTGDTDSCYGTCLSGIKEMLKPKEEPLAGLGITMPVVGQQIDACVPVP